MSEEPTAQKCPLFGKLFGGCKFEARYDLSAPDLRGMYDLTATTRQLEALRRRTYVRDVCVRCGRVVERGRDGAG